MKFNLKRPCDNCPFRNDKKFPLGKGRAAQIAHSILVKGQTFACHKTVDYNSAEENGNGEVTYQNREQESHCAGALIMMQNMGCDNSMTQIAERLGLYKPERMDKNAPVYRDHLDFINGCKDEF